MNKASEYFKASEYYNEAILTSLHMIVSVLLEMKEQEKEYWDAWKKAKDEENKTVKGDIY